MNKDLTPEQRLRRIAEIINKGIFLLALKEGWFDENPVKQKESKIDLRERQKVIMAHLESKSRITNKEVCELFGVSRDTAHRELKHLLQTGLLKVKGSGRSVVYFK